MKHYEIGYIVTYKTFFDGVRRVKVASRWRDTRDGSAGFSGVDMNSRRNVWGYDDQILAYEKETKPEAFSPIG